VTFSTGVQSGDGAVNFSYTLPANGVIVTASEPSANYGDSVTFTANVFPGSATGTVQFQVDGNDVGTPAPITTSTVAGGTATYVTSSLQAGSHTVTAIYSGDDNNATDSGSLPGYTVNPAVPSVAWSAPADISYGTALSATQLDASATLAGSPVAGTFAYSPAVGAILTAGQQTLNVIFTPTDTADYATQVSQSTTITVDPAPLTVTAKDQSITWPSEPDETFDSSSISVTGLVASDTLDSLAGSIDSSYSPSANDNDSYSLIPSMADANYIPTYTNGKLTVHAANIGLSLSQPDDITYGTGIPTMYGLINTTLDAPINGTFVFSPSPGTILTPGQHLVRVTFTPSNAYDLEPTSATATLTVDRAPLTVTASSASINYGAKVPAITARFSGLVPEDMSPAHTCGTSAFQGSDAGGYVTGCNVQDGNYAVTYVEGLLTISPDATTTAVAPGSQNNPSNYGDEAAFTAEVTSSFATPTGSVNFYDGGTLADTESLNGNTATFDTDALAGGSHTITATYVPDANGNGVTNYLTSTSSQTVTQIVTPASPKRTATLAWIQPADITYGTALSTDQLDATATFNGNPVAGTFAYTTDAGTVLHAGTGQTLSATFTPADPIDYTSGGTVGTTINVNPAPLTVTAQDTTITWPGDFDHAFDANSLNVTGLQSPDKLSDLGGTITSGYVAGTSAAGSYSLIPSITDSDYTLTPVNGTLTVNPATPVLKWTQPDDITYGTALSTEQLDATATLDGNAVAGTFVYTTGVGTVLHAGTAQPLSATFTPTDSTNYTSGSIGTTMNVHPAPLTVTALDSTIAWPADFDHAFDANSVNATGLENSDSLGDLGGVISSGYLAGTSDAGTYTLNPSIADADYTLTPVSGTLTVDAVRPVISWSTPADITYGTALSATQFDATATFNGDPVPGKFSYSPAAGTVLRAGQNWHLHVTFTPSDSADFGSAAQTATTTITVDKAPLVVTPSGPAITYGADTPPITAAYAGLQNGDAAPATPPTCSTQAPGSFAPVGTYTTRCTGAHDPNYDISYGRGTLTVTKAELTIVPDDQTVVFGAKLPSLTWKADFLGTDTRSVLKAQPTCTASVTMNSSRDVTSDPGPYQIICSGGSAKNYSFAYQTGSLTVTVSPDLLTYRGPRTLQVGQQAQLSAQLTSPQHLDIADQSVTLTLFPRRTKMQQCTGTTDPTGTVTCTISTVANYQGSKILAITFAGNTDYAARAKDVSVTVQSQSPI
jgi:hypothetical protein